MFFNTRPSASLSRYVLLEERNRSCVVLAAPKIDDITLNMLQLSLSLYQRARVLQSTLT